MPVPDPVSEQILQLQEWFAREPADDPVVDLAGLRGHFALLPDAGADAAQLEQYIGQFEVRIQDLCGRFKARLLNAALPLPHGMHAAAGELVAALLEVAGSLRGLVNVARERWRPSRRTNPQTLAARALGLIHEAFVVAAMGGGGAPAGLWRDVYGLVRASGGFDALVAPRADTAAACLAHSVKRLLALAVLQPESLTARELVWANDYLEGAADSGALSAEPLQPVASSFWINPDADTPPVATIRGAVPAIDGLMYFSAFGISRAVSAQMESLKVRLAAAEADGLEQDEFLLAPDGSGLPVGLTPTEAASLMARMRDRWAVPPNRSQTRRAYQYSVQVCVGLRAIWETVRSTDASSRIAEWMVYNESPGGYAIMSVSGVTGSLGAGMAVALRRDADHPWTICIVRWIRSDSPGQVELGLQLLAQACTPVSIGFRGADAHALTPALILPPVVALRRNLAILAPAGSYASRRFVLVQEGERLYVAQACVLSLDMQTAHAELFQYEIDPYPM